MRRTTSIAIGESGISFLPAALRRAFSSRSAMAKNGRRACTQHAASRIGPGFRPAQVELVVAVIGVGLQDAGISGQMRLRMLALAIARVIEHRRRRPRAAKRPVVAHIDPASPGVGFALGQHRHGRVVPMQALGRHDMGFDKAPERIERRADRPHRVGHGRQRDRHAFQGVALGLTVQRLMLAELLEHDHRQQARPRPAPGDDMERRRRLADLLAVPAGELLPHRLDHLPLTRHRFQRPRHVLAELAQAIAAAAFARRRRIDHHALAGKMVGERIALGTLARKSAHRRRLGDGLFRREFVFRGAGFQLFERRAPTDRSAAPSAPIVARRPDAPAWRSAASAGQSAPCSSDALRATASRANAAFRAATSSGTSVGRAASMTTSRIINSVICGALKCTTTPYFYWLSPRSSVATSVADFASRSLPACRPSAPPRSTPHRPTPRAR